MTVPVEGSMKKIPNIDISQWKFSYLHSPDSQKAEYKSKILQAIEKDEMAPYYAVLCDELKWPVDGKLFDKLKKLNEQALAKLEEKRIDVEKNLGDTEVMDVMLEKADYYCQIGDKENAGIAYQAVVEKTGSLGIKLDVTFNKIRLAMLYNDAELISQNIEKAKVMIDEGGDWDRRNRLKVYEGVYRMTIRDFKTSAKQFLETLSTFTSTELISYKDFVKYTIICSMISLDRVDIKKQLIHSPDVVEVLHEIHPFESYMNSLYNCNYKEFFLALSQVEQIVKADYLLNRHCRYIVREMRILAYSQLLESYRSVTLNSMAHSFGVSEEFIDKELSRFIAAGRLNCVIDKVKGVVETNRPDHKNAQYQSTIRQGDLLLNRVQKLSRVIHL